MARALLTEPAQQALAGLPVLRRQLMAAGNPLSTVFWDATERCLRRMADLEASRGDLRAWVEATGSEPTQLLGGHVWDDDGERGPVADEMHGLLVAYLEGLVTEGAIQPDRLAAGDAQALREYQDLQGAWLFAELPDGRVPVHEIWDEEADAFDEGWAMADAEALEALEGVLEEVGRPEVPVEELARACARVRDGLRQGGPPFDLLASAGGMDPADLPPYDELLWLLLAQGVVNPIDAPPEDDDAESIASWYALQHADWLGAVAGIARAHAGVVADPEALAQMIVDCPEVEDDLDDSDDPDEMGMVASGFFMVVQLWRVLGAVDDDDRLTALGHWGLPEALRREWSRGPER